MDEKIEKLFRDILKVSKEKNYLLTQVNKECDSYYEPIKHTDQAFFSFIDLTSQDSLAKELADFFSKVDTPEFAPLANEIAQLSYMLRANTAEQSDHLSEYLYAMY